MTYLRVGSIRTPFPSSNWRCPRLSRARLELTYLCSMRMNPLDAIGLLQMDLAAAFAVSDLVPGGPANGAFELRDLTEIEEQILETVMRILNRELQSASARCSPFMHAGEEYKDILFIRLAKFTNGTPRRAESLRGLARKMNLRTLPIEKFAGEYLGGGCRFTSRLGHPRIFSWITCPWSARSVEKPA